MLPSDLMAEQVDFGLSQSATLGPLEAGIGFGARVNRPVTLENSVVPVLLVVGGLVALTLVLRILFEGSLGS